MKNPPPYNPLEKSHLAESVANALLGQPAGPLPPSRRFDGAGVYAIYYAGLYEPYKRIRQQNIDGMWDSPIYIGRAVPSGSRRGTPNSDAPVGDVLHNRLRQHARSIDQATNLSLGDFACRYLVVDDIWIPLAETMLIQRYWTSAVWNSLLDGFGIHDPGSGRRQQRRSAWDTVHPGRPFAAGLPDSSQPAEEWKERIVASLAARSD